MKTHKHIYGYVRSKSIILFLTIFLLRTIGLIRNSKLQTILYYIFLYRFQQPIWNSIVNITNFSSWIPPNSNNKFLKSFIILKLDVWSIKLSSGQTATGSSIRQKMNTIAEEQLISWNIKYKDVSNRSQVHSQDHV